MKNNGTMAERFENFMKTDYHCEDYAYDISIPETLLFGLGSFLIKASYFVIAIVGALTAPIWAIPYVLIVKAIEKNQEV